MRHLKESIAALTACLFTVSVARADLATDMNDFFNNVGLANVTPPGVYETQAGGFYSGGDIFFRTPARNVQPMSVQLPSYRAGCGGIDFHLGSFSVLNDSAYIEQFLRNVAGQAYAYLFQVALATISPKLHDAMMKVSDWAKELNAFNINSCETSARTAYGIASMIPGMDQNVDTLCSSVGVNSGGFADWGGARRGCQADASATLAAARTDPTYSPLLQDGNMTWRAVTRLSARTPLDTEMMEILMNMVGAVIVNPGATNASARSINYVPLTLLKKDYESFLRGGTINFKGCADGTAEFECRNVTAARTITISANAFVTRIRTILLDLVDRAVTNSAPSSEQLTILNGTRLPVYKMLNVATTYSSAFARQQVNKYSEAIALDLLAQYFETLTLMLRELPAGLTLTADQQKQFHDSIQTAQAALDAVKKDQLEKLDETIVMVQETMTIERMLISGMTPGMASSYNWAKGIR